MLPGGNVACAGSFECKGRPLALQSQQNTETQKATSVGSNEVSPWTNTTIILANATVIQVPEEW